MDPKQLLAALLGISPDASDADFENAAKTFASTCKTLSASAGKIEGLTTLSAEDVTILKSLKDLPDSLKGLAAKVEAIEKAGEAGERNEIIRDATLQGKAIPAGVLSGDGALNNTQLKHLCASLPVTVPLDRRTVALSAEPEVLQHSTEELQIFNALGLSKDQVDKHAKD